VRLVLKQKKVPEWKVQVVEELSKLIRDYPTIALVSLEKVPADLIQKIRAIVRQLYEDEVRLVVAKNTLFKLAAKKVGLKGLDALEPLLAGQKLFVFSKLNAFSLFRVLESVKVPMPAEAGMVVDREIVVPACDTKMPPGPILSTFGRLRIPTRVQGGTIWIAKETRVAKPGDVISPELASLLKKLDIYPFEAGLRVEAILEGGVLLRREELSLNLDEYKELLAKVKSFALLLGAEAAVPAPEALQAAVLAARRKALRVAAEAGLLVKGHEGEILTAALARAYAVVAALGEKAKEVVGEGLAALTARAAAQPEPPKAEEKKREEKKEEAEEEKKELSEEDLAAGLSALFG